MARALTARILLALLVLPCAAGLGTLAGCDGGASQGDQMYWCPMCPEIGKRHRPGQCSKCSMTLEVFEAGTVGSDPGVLQLTDRQVQQTGVRLGTAELRHLVREIDTSGRLDTSPRRRRTLALRFPESSRVERLHVRTAGEIVREGQVLVELQNSVMTSLLNDYRKALKKYGLLRREGKTTEAEALLTRANGMKNQLAEWGVPRRYVDVLAVKPKHLFTEPIFPVRAPVGGALLADAELDEGSYARSGTTLFRIADLDELWLYVDVYEHERPLVEKGQQLSFQTLAVPDRSFRATIRALEPVVHQRTQTTRARCTVPNRDGVLAPGMFVRVSIYSRVPNALSVPESAVLQSGRRDVVLVSEGGGRFRPKLVRVGRRHLSTPPREEEDASFGASEERFHEILGGVNAGDKVVVAGNFLLNAEAQFQGVLKKMFAAADAEEAAPQIAQHLEDELEAVLGQYFSVSRALFKDDAAALPGVGAALQVPSRTMLADRDRIDPRFARLAEAAAGLATHIQGTDLDLEVVRKHFGTLSREIVGWLRDCAPTRVATGELFVFRCPMAEDYGFELWVQDHDDLSNPYMGQRMPKCGMPAELQ